MAHWINGYLKIRRQPRLRPLFAIILVFFLSCNAQDKNQAQDSGDNFKASGKGQPRLIKTQGTDKYANIQCAVMDAHGNLWFGTTGEGVYVYNRESFFQFTKKDGLTTNIVRSILQDTDGTMLLGTDSGLCRYNAGVITNVPITETSGPFFPGKQRPALPSAKNEVWSMMRDKKGTTWLGTSNGVFCYKDAVFSRFPGNTFIINKDSLQLKMVDRIIQDKAGNIWFASGMPPGMEGLCRYDGKSLVSFKPGGEKWIRYVLEDKDGGLWLGTRHKGVWRYDGKNFSPFMKGNDIGLSALADKEGNIWLSGGENQDGYSSNGYVYRYNGISLDTISTNKNAGGYGVWTMVQDKAGNIWFGTRNIGLFRYDGKSLTSFSE